jgi:primosomal protein N' (replication factor Y)
VQPYCRVAIDSPVFALDRAFDYSIPERMHGRVHVGSVVRVPLHGRRVRAFVTDLLDEPAVSNPRPLSALVSPEPLFAPPEIDLARWIAARYVTTLGVVLHEATPGRYSTTKPGDPAPSPNAPRPPWLGAHDLDAPSSVCVVTSRAELDLIPFAASHGGQTLVVCPRVDVAESLAARIPGSVLVHGEQRPAARAAAWASAGSGRARVVVGGRAALLAPMPDLQLVVVASAHDPGLRAERTPRLHALVVARERAKRAGARFLAASAAPPLELCGEDTKIVQPRLPAGVRTELARPMPKPVTDRLLDVLKSATDRGADALVFVARRGGVLRARCDDCGWQAPATGAPDVCPRCGGRLSKRGWGHGRVAGAIERTGVSAPVVQLVRGDELEAPPAPVIVVGTLAAAHNWPRDFGAIAVADADQLLGRQDFRAAERALGMFHELAARLEPGGRFLLQTRESEHHAVQAFVRRSFRFFAERELPLRREAGYPPFGEIVIAESAPADGRELGDAMRRLGAIVLGPVEGRGGADRLLIRARRVDPLLGPLRAFAEAHRGTRLEVDPVDVI